MYLIVYGNHHEKEIVEAKNLKDALATLYDSFGGS